MPNSSFVNHFKLLKPTMYYSTTTNSLLHHRRLLRPLPPHRHRTQPPPPVSSSSSSSLSLSSSSLSLLSLTSSCVILKRTRGSCSSLSTKFYQQKLGYGRFAYDEYASDSEGECHTASSQQLGDSTVDNVEEWRWKFTLLMRNNNEQELVSKEKKDRRDFEHISTMASRMGLHSRQYGKMVVFSKFPLPNYRPDLDDKRPQRVVELDSIVQERVEDHLKAYLSKKAVIKGNAQSNVFTRSAALSTDQVVNQVDDTSPKSMVAERILRRRSLEIRNRQQDWQGSPEGQKMIEFRKSLPAHKERDTLLAAVSQNQVVVVSGETGCGKTTQLPQYILESEIEAERGATCNIICTQPRRISAMAVSERVAAERGESLGESVGYKVRLEGIRGRDTRLLFCTTGILLRRLLLDRELKGVTHVIVDEIHERGMNEDFLLIVLKDLLPRRPDLRLVLMSATLNAELFSSYFGAAPMIHIPGFTFPVRSYFLENILEATGYRLTPYNQIDNYGEDKKWKMQKQTLRKRKTQIASAVEGSLEAADFTDFSRQTRESLSCWNPDSIGFNLIENVLSHICRNERPGAVLVFMTGWDDINSLKDQLQSHPILGDPSRVLLLACHGSMSSAEQKLIFNKPEDGIRKIVLATNMAETSITINDVVFVVDCGKAKETSYDALNNTPCLLPSWISKASAKQRRGRAGRVQAGECYHLYPRCVHNSLSEYQLPELLRTPLQSLCLQIKSLQLGSISEFLSKALQSPESLSVENAIEYLKTIGALDEKENLTVLGHKLSMIPVEPKLGKMLVYGAIFNCLDPIMTVVAGLSSRDPFMMPFDKKDLAESAKAQFAARDFSDHLALVRAYDGWKEAERKQNGHEYCWHNFLSSQTLRAIDSLRKQFFYLLKEIGLVDNLETCNMWSEDNHLIRSVICAGLFPGICSVVNKDKSISLKTMEDGPVLLYANSVNAQEFKVPRPWLVFNDKVKVNSVFLRDSTAVSDSMVLLFGGSILPTRLESRYGHLTMLGGYLEFFTRRSLADTYLRLKTELDEFIQMKLLNPKLAIGNQSELLSAVRFLVREDQCEGKFVYAYKPAIPKKAEKELQAGRLLANGAGGNNSKSLLQNMLVRAGHQTPIYKTKQSKNNKFLAIVMFNGMDFTGRPCNSKKEAEKSAAGEALEWLTGETQSSQKTVDHAFSILKKTQRMPKLQTAKQW